MYTFYKALMSNYVNVNIVTVNNKSTLHNKTDRQHKNISNLSEEICIQIPVATIGANIGRRLQGS